jgi:hypothetical protein
MKSPDIDLLPVFMAFDHSIRGDTRRLAAGLQDPGAVASDAMEDFAIK